MFARLLFISAIFLSVSGKARTLVQCRIHQVVDASYFEHTASEDSWPTVLFQGSELDGLNVNIGSNEYSTWNGDQIHYQTPLGFNQVISVTPRRTGDEIVISVSGPPAPLEGYLSVIPKGESKKKLLAKLICKGF